MKKWIILLILVGILGNAFLVKGPFLWDDEFFIVENPNIRQIHFKDYFLKPHWLETGFAMGFRGFYRPLVSLSFAVDYQLYKLDSRGYHLTNIFFHILASILLFLVLLEIGFTESQSFLASAIFSSAATLREAVAWISARGDIFALFFMLLSFYLIMKRKDLWAILVFPFALFSKEMSVVFPFFLMVYFYYKREKFNRVLPFLVLDFLFLILRSQFTSSRILSTYSIPILITRTFKALGFYFVQGVFPFTGRVFLSPMTVYTKWWFYIPAALFIMLVAAFVFKRTSKVFLLSAMSFILLLPSLAVVWIEIPHTVAFRFGYIPAAFLVPISVLLLSSREILKKVVLPVFLAGAIVNSNIVNLYWTSSSFFWEKTHLDAPEDPYFAIRLAGVYIQKGRVKDAESLLQGYLDRTNSYTPVILHILALIEESRGNLRKAEALLTNSIFLSREFEKWEMKTYGELVYDLSSHYIALSRILRKQGRIEDAEKLMKSGFSSYGKNPDFRDEYAIVLGLAGKCENAIKIASKRRESVLEICALWKKKDLYSRAKIMLYRNQFEKAKELCSSIKENIKREKCLSETEERMKRMGLLRQNTK